MACEFYPREKEARETWRGRRGAETMGWRAYWSKLTHSTEKRWSSQNCTASLTVQRPLVTCTAASSDWLISEKLPQSHVGGKVHLGLVPSMVLGFCLIYSPGTRKVKARELAAVGLHFSYCCKCSSTCFGCFCSYSYMLESQGVLVHVTKF